MGSQRAGGPPEPDHRTGDPAGGSAGAESRDRIRDAALELFARHGYERTSVRMIAERADVSQGLMYNYFDGKRGLLRAVMERGMEDVRESFASAPAGAGAEARLEALIRSSFEIVARNSAFWRLSYGVRMQPAVLEDLADDIRAWSAGIRHELERHFRALGAADPDAEAAALFGLIDGVAQHYVLYPEHYPLERVADRVVDRYCRPGTGAGAGSGGDAGGTADRSPESNSSSTGD